MLLQQLLPLLSKHLQSPVTHAQRVSGGSINECYRIHTLKQAFFCKHNSASKFPLLFIKEKDALECINSSGYIKTPKVLDCFEEENRQFLLLEWIEEGPRNKAFWVQFGEELAAMHLMKGTDFGWRENNYIGSVEQNNTYSNNWILFFMNQRLIPLAEKCLELHLLEKRHFQQFEHLWKVMPVVFDSNEQPFLVHGDLWNRNFLCNYQSQPYLIDPAIYYGHPSLDMGMTDLFKGFGQEFYRAYQYHRPFQPNYKEQWNICNLYPLLIHLFLFGSSYKNPIEAILNKFN
ncbi:MAG: fructosamine kinase family protein [Flavisolibacter sp.]